VDNIDAREVKLDPTVRGRGGPADRGPGRPATGPYLERDVDGTAQRANLSDDPPPDELTLEIAEKLFATPQEGRVLAATRSAATRIVARTGRFGPFVTEILPELEGSVKGKKVKPRTGSLLRTMSLDTVTLEDALRGCCRCHRVVGVDRPVARRSPRRTAGTGPT